jgi:hypothetical protein
MFRKVFQVLGRLNGSTQFEGYLQALQGHDCSVAPTRDQARREYFRLFSR